MLTIEWWIKNYKITSLREVKIFLLIFLKKIFNNNYDNNIISIINLDEKIMWKKVQFKYKLEKKF